jgi:hypothetical protein
MMYRTRGHTRARLYYERIARDARREGRDDIAAIAELRSAIRHLPPNSQMQMTEIKRIANLQGEQMKTPVLEAKLALARMAYQKGDEATAQGIQKELASFNIKRPILIYAPSYAMAARELDSGSEFDFPLTGPPATGGEPSGQRPGPVALQARASISSSLAVAQWSTMKRIAGNFDDMWIDVSFRITAEGKVSDAKIIRSKGDLFWTKPLMISIAGRRYTPGTLHDPSSVRTERYTYTSGYEGQTSTRMAMRSPKARVEYIDLSDMAAPQ